eukprot:1353382-Pyramimonas_sp.AAC.1
MERRWRFWNDPRARTNTHDLVLLDDDRNTELERERAQLDRVETEAGAGSRVRVWESSAGWAGDRQADTQVLVFACRQWRGRGQYLAGILRSAAPAAGTHRLPAAEGSRHLAPAASTHHRAEAPADTRRPAARTRRPAARTRLLAAAPAGTPRRAGAPAGIPRRAEAPVGIPRRAGAPAGIHRRAAARTRRPGARH